MHLSQAIHDFKGWRSVKVQGLTVARYDSVLRIFCLCTGDPHIEDITPERVVHHLLEMQRLGWKRNGISIVALALRKFFEYYNLKGHKVMDEQLIPLPRKEFNIPRVATLEQFKKLLDTMPKKTNHPNHLRNRALVSLLWDTGARVGEALSLDVDELDLKARRALIRTEKSRGRRPVREIFWTPQTNVHLKAWIGKRKHLAGVMEFADPEALFLTITKNPQTKIRGRRMTTRGAAEIFRMMSNQAKIPTVNAHSLRHAFGRDIIKRGGSNSDVSNLLGHSSLESSQFYTMMWGEDLRERYKLFIERGRGSRQRAAPTQRHAPVYSVLRPLGKRV